MCPFIKENALCALLRQTGRPRRLRVLTRFNLQDFAARVSDICALIVAAKRGGAVRGVRNLHAKMYVFGQTAIVTSANLTMAALTKNHELGFVSDEPEIVDRCVDVFDQLWARVHSDASVEQLEAWRSEIDDHLAARPGESDPGLPDKGADLKLTVPGFQPSVDDAPQAYVKFLGSADRRERLSWPTVEEVKRAGCHWALAYPQSKRPTGVADGALMFVGRLTERPNDIRVFGRAIGMKHVRGRDDASRADRVRRDWKNRWPCYIRVHHCEFVDGTMKNGVSLNDLMDELGSASYATTSENARRGRGNIDPRKSVRRQAAVRLSAEAAAWLNERLETAFARHGRITEHVLSGID